MNGDCQSLDSIIRQAAGQLAAAEIEEPLHEARLIMEDACQIKIVQQLSQADRSLSENEIAIFFDLIEQRKQGIPFAYLQGKASFYGREFLVNHCLIPRPETELILDLVLTEAANFTDESCRFLDLCTGSGCLALSIYLELKEDFECRALLTELSDQALQTCKKNIEKYKAEQRLYALKADLFPSKTQLEKIKNKDSFWQQFTFDLIVANPPYVKSQDIADLDKSVKQYEPHLALDGGTDGLDFYRRIAKEIKPFIKKNKSTLILEHGADQSADIIEIFEKSDLQILDQIQKNDLQGHDRILVFSLKV